MKLCSSDNHYTTVPLVPQIMSKDTKHSFESSNHNFASNKILLRPKCHSRVEYCLLHCIWGIKTILGNSSCSSNHGHGYTKSIPQSSTPYFISNYISLKLKDRLSRIIENKKHFHQIL